VPKREEEGLFPWMEDAVQEFEELVRWEVDRDGAGYA